jgi:hypothetical protein
MEVEAISIDVLERELTQAPRLFLEGLDDPGPDESNPS